MSDKPIRTSISGPDAIPLLNRGKSWLRLVDAMPDAFGPGNTLNEVIRNSLGNRTLIGLDGSVLRTQRGPINFVSAQRPEPLGEAAKNIVSEQPEFFLAIEAFNGLSQRIGILYTKLPQLYAGVTVNGEALPTSWKFVPLARVTNLTPVGAADVKYGDGTLGFVRAPGGISFTTAGGVVCHEVQPTNPESYNGELVETYAVEYTSSLVLSPEEVALPGTAAVTFPMVGILNKCGIGNLISSTPWSSAFWQDDRFTTMSASCEAFGGGAVSGSVGSSEERVNYLRRGSITRELARASLQKSTQITFPVLYDGWVHYDRTLQASSAGSRLMPYAVADETAFAVAPPEAVILPARRPIVASPDQSAVALAVYDYGFQLTARRDSTTQAPAPMEIFQPTESGTIGPMNGALPTTSGKVRAYINDTDIEIADAGSQPVVFTANDKLYAPVENAEILLSMAYLYDGPRLVVFLAGVGGKVLKSTLVVGEPVVVDEAAGACYALLGVAGSGIANPRLMMSQ